MESVNLHHCRSKSSIDRHLDADPSHVSTNYEAFENNRYTMSTVISSRKLMIWMIVERIVDLHTHVFLSEESGNIYVNLTTLTFS